jgi:hypothetical protein
MSAQLRIRHLATLGILTMTLGLPISAFAAGGSAKVSSSRAMEARLEALERQNQLLEEQNRAIQGQLSAQKSQIDSLKQQIQGTTQPVATLQQKVPALKQQVEAVKLAQIDLPFSVGFRTGWSESPYDMPGGFFYGAYLNHRLLSPEDGIPGGFVSGELMAGLTQGNHVVNSGNLGSIVTGKNASAWLDTVQIQPTVQYHLDPALIGFPQLASVKPYVLAGPAMWINLMSTQLVVKSGPGSGYRHYDADVQGGGVFGLGTEMTLGMLRLEPVQRILDKTFVGAEWRYNQFGNGQAFQQYTGSVGFGW